MNFCHLCAAVCDNENPCDFCDEFYCEYCSYIFSLHYQYEGNQCVSCSDQRRIKPLTREIIRNNQLNRLLNYGI